MSRRKSHVQTGNVLSILNEGHSGVREVICCEHLMGDCGEFYVDSILENKYWWVSPLAHWIICQNRIGTTDPNLMQPKPTQTTLPRLILVTNAIIYIGMGSFGLKVIFRQFCFSYLFICLFKMSFKRMPTPYNLLQTFRNGSSSRCCHRLFIYMLNFRWSRSLIVKRITLKPIFNKRMQFM